ncbi:hypothetical protein DV738_g1123, partial [Chaetothyriales sp. CBS 135597]
MTYCSPDLNSGIFPAMSDLFQSTGLCADHCRGSYAFAVIQGYNCWCSSYIPADQPKSDSSTSEPESDSSTDSAESTTSAQVTSTDALGQASTGSGGHGVSTGKVVGIVFGVALGIGLIVGLLLWLWFRLRRRQESADFSSEGSFAGDRNGGKRSGPNSSGGNSIPSRQVSQLSTAGLLGRSPKVTSGGTPDLRRAGTGGSGFDRLSLGTDQRLNPWALYGQEDRLSNVSLQDNQDYSRQLRVANPD